MEIGASELYDSVPTEFEGSARGHSGTSPRQDNAEERSQRRRGQGTNRQQISAFVFVSFAAIRGSMTSGNSQAGSTTSGSDIRTFQGGCSVSAELSRPVVLMAFGHGKSRPMGQQVTKGKVPGKMAEGFVWHSWLELISGTHFLCDDRHRYPTFGRFLL